MVGAAGFEPATPSSRTPRQGALTQAKSISYEPVLSAHFRSFTLFHWPSIGPFRIRKTTPSWNDAHHATERQPAPSGAMGPNRGTRPRHPARFVMAVAADAASPQILRRWPTGGGSCIRHHPSERF